MGKFTIHNKCYKITFTFIRNSKIEYSVWGADIGKNCFYRQSRIFQVRARHDILQAGDKIPWLIFVKFVGC